MSGSGEDHVNGVTFRYHSSACRNGRGTKEPKLTQQVFATLPDDLSGSALNTTVRKTLEDMEMVFFDERYTRSVKKLLSYVVEKIILTPIKGRHRGETITVQINKTGWLEFYLFAGENWQREV